MPKKEQEIKTTENNNNEKNYNIHRASHINFGWFSCESSILIALEFWNAGFSGGGKTRRSREKPLEQDDNQRKLNPQMTPGWNWTQAILVGDKHSHDCTKPAPHIFMFTCIEVSIKSSPKTYLLMKQLILCLRIISTFSFIFCYKSNIKAVIVLSSISMKNLKWE